MDKQTDAFIVKYKILEDTLSKQGKTVYDFEQGLDEKSAKKMQLCRLTRNFLQHENESFIVPSKSMIAFLEAQIKEALKSVQTVKDAMTRRQAILSEEKVKDIVGKFAKAKDIPVVDKSGAFLGCLTPQVMCSVIAVDGLNKKLSSCMVHYVMYPTLTQDVPMSDVPVAAVSGTFVVVDAKTGKYKGLLTV